MTPNETRNEELVFKRLEDVTYWSYKRLGMHYKITKQTAQEIFERDLPKYATKAQIAEYNREMKALYSYNARRQELSKA